MKKASNRQLLIYMGHIANQKQGLLRNFKNLLECHSSQDWNLYQAFLEAELSSRFHPEEPPHSLRFWHLRAEYHLSCNQEETLFHSLLFQHQLKEDRSC